MIKILILISCVDGFFYERIGQVKSKKELEQLRQEFSAGKDFQDCEVFIEPVKELAND